MKSLLVSVFWPAWEWASNPSLRYLTASYSDGLTVRDNRRVRSIVMSDWNARADGQQVMVREEQEPGSSGKAVITARAKAMSGFNYAGVQVSADKVVRADPYRTQVPSGDVALVRSSWNHDYLHELADFPVGVHDDQVDASSCCFNAVALEERPQVRKGGTFGRGYRRY